MSTQTTFVTKTNKITQRELTDVAPEELVLSWSRVETAARIKGLEPARRQLQDRSYFRLSHTVSNERNK